MLPLKLLAAFNSGDLEEIHVMFRKPETHAGAVRAFIDFPSGALRWRGAQLSDNTRLTRLRQRKHARQRLCKHCLSSFF